MKLEKVLTMVILSIVLLPALSVPKPVVEILPPPGMFHIEQLWRLILNNPDQETYPVWLEGIITEARKGEVVWAKTKGFKLPPGTLVLHYADIQRIGIESQTHAPGYERFLTRTGGLPEGNYTFIVLLQPDLGGDTVEFQIRLPGPPRLIAPKNGASISEEYPLFGWDPPSPPPAEKLTYNIKIVELLPKQTEEEALAQNEPWLEEKGITATSFKYPAGAPKLTEGKNYCWQVTALVAGLPITTSEIWAFGFGPPAKAESCQYYLDENGRMWHSLGKTGQIGIRPDPCKYILTYDGTMYHADGQKWSPVSAEICTFIIAENGVFHFNGKTWHKIPVGKCDCILTKNGMFHYDGKIWEAVIPDSCTYVLVKDEKSEKKMYHADGRSWSVKTFNKCSYVQTKFGMYHFNGKSWDLITVNKCTGIKAENGLFHFDGKDWVLIKPDSCRYFLVSDPVNKKNTMFHGDGKTWSPKTFDKCKYIGAQNGMFHFNGKTWDPITGKPCTAILAENGLFHYDGKIWVPVKPDSCTYMLVTDPIKKQRQMFHANGRTWNEVAVGKCRYIKANNGMFHFTGNDWELVILPNCKYIKAENGMFHSRGKGIWVPVPGFNCQWIEAENGWFHHNGKTWNPAESCNYRVEVQSVGKKEIVAKVWHYDGKRWNPVVSKNIPIGKPKHLPACTYYFEEEKPNEYILYHCVEDDQPEELTRIRIE